MIVKKIFKTHWWEFLIAILAHWWEFLIAILFVATIANVVITQDIFGLLLGLFSGIASALLFSLSLDIEEEKKLQVASIVMLLVMLFCTSIVNVPKEEILILEDKNTIQVVTERSVFVLPFTKKVVRVTDFEVVTVVELLNDGKRIQWDVNAELKLASGHDRVFNLIREYGSKDAWWEEIRKRIQNVAQEYVKETFHEPNLPLEFEITLGPEKKKNILELGYEVVKIKATNGRILKKQS
jgi:hypothetical protein